MRLTMYPIILIMIALSFHASAAMNIERLADDDWLYITSKNFEIITDLDEIKGKQLVEDLESYRFFSMKILELNLLPGIKPLKILAIAHNKNFRRLNLPETWAGVFSLDAFGYSAIANVAHYGSELEAGSFSRQVLFHEYNHFLMRFSEHTQYYPMWYDEGMAEYWASFKYDREKIYIGDSTIVKYRINDLVNDYGNIILDSKRLFNTIDMPMTSAKESDKSLIGQFYAQAFFMVHYLHSTPELRFSLENYIQYINQGYRENDAFKKAFKMDYVDLDKNAKKYLRKNLMMHIIEFQDNAVHFSTPEIKIQKMGNATFYSKVSDILPNYDVIASQSIKALLEKNIQLNPDDVNAKALLLVHHLADNPEKLMAAIEKTEPTNAMLLTYKADQLRTESELLRYKDDFIWKQKIDQSREYYRLAIKSDPEFPLPYFGLGNLYNFMPTTETLEEGSHALQVAALYARDGSTFANLADLLIRMDKGLSVLPVLRNAIAFSKQKERSAYSLIYDNLELLNDLREIPATVSTGGLLFANGSVYTGSVLNNKPNGPGKMVRSSGSYFEGNFVDGVMQGRGKLVTYGGFIYNGEFQQGIARGKGEIVYPEGFFKKFYSGDIYYSFPYGKGVEITKYGKYEGEFWYSFYQGEGILTANNGKVLTGKWIQQHFIWPEINGEVIANLVDGDGEPDGQGVCINSQPVLHPCKFKNGVLQAENH